MFWDLLKCWQYFRHEQHPLKDEVQVGREPRVRELCRSVVVVNKVDAARGCVSDLPSWRQWPQLLTIYITKIPTEPEREKTQREQAKKMFMPKCRITACKIDHEHTSGLTLLQTCQSDIRMPEFWNRSCKCLFPSLCITVCVSFCPL